MWIIVHPLVSQCYQTVSVARGRVLSSGAVLMASHWLLRPAVTIPLVYMPLKDYELVALQQLS